MTKTQRLIQIAVVAAALLLPASAFASGPVHDALAGSVLDPMATTLKVVPPRGGAVMVYRNGKLKSWFLQPGLVTVQPGHVYGVMASRGSYMLFNAGIMMRDGFTELSWQDGNNTPAMAYYPGYSNRHRRPHRVAAHRTHPDQRSARQASKRGKRGYASARRVDRGTQRHARRNNTRTSRKLIDPFRKRHMRRAVGRKSVDKKSVKTKTVTKRAGTTVTKKTVTTRKRVRSRVLLRKRSRIARTRL
jgi:hypothetical protein